MNAALHIHPTPTHLMNKTRASPFVAALPLPRIIMNANRRKQLGETEGLERRHAVLTSVIGSASQSTNTIFSS